MHEYRQALVVLLILGCTRGVPAEQQSSPQRGIATWQACQVPADCTWTIGEAGWPAAVDTESVAAYREWVESQAAFTTYFMPGDCFVHNDEFESYVSRSKSSIACLDGACTLAIEPVCTK